MVKQILSPLGQRRWPRTPCAMLRDTPKAAPAWLAESDLSQEVLDAIRAPTPPSQGSGAAGRVLEDASGEYTSVPKP